jgi:hypothetical protein
MTIKVPASEIIHENGHRFIEGRHTGLRTLSGQKVCMNCGAIRRADGNPSCCEAHAAAPHDELKIQPALVQVERAAAAV